MHRALVQRIASEAFAGHKKACRSSYYLSEPIEKRTALIEFSMVEGGELFMTLHFGGLYIFGGFYFFSPAALQQDLHATIPLNMFFSSSF